MITRSMKRLIKESSTNLTIDVTVKSDNLKKRHYTQSKDDDKNADKKLRRSRKIKRKKDVKNSDLIIKGEPKLDFESKEVKNELVIDTVKKEAVGDTKAKLVGAHVSVAGMHSKQNDGKH